MIASPFLTAIKEAAQYLGKKLDEVKSAIKENTKIDLSGPINAQTRSLSAALSRFEASVEKIKDPKFTGEVVVDTASLEKAIGDVRKSLKEPNLKNIERSLDNLYACFESKMEKQSKALEAGLTAIARSLSELDISVPSTFKLDEMQIRAISNKGPSVNGGILAARNITQTNLALTATDTQYTYTFPANTTAWQIKLRDQGTLGYYSFTTGTLPSVGGGGDGSKYTTIPQNFVRGADGVDWSGKTIYLGAESATQVAEIEVFTL